MNEIVHWNPVFPANVVWLTGVGLLLFFGWLELRKQYLLFWRLLALVIALLSMCLLILRPSILSHDSTRPVLLLTPGYNPSALDSLMNLRPLEVIRLEGAHEFQDSKVMSNLGDLYQIAPRIEFVLGEGIPEFMDDPSFHFDYVAGEPIDGITMLSSDTAYANRPVSIKGNLINKGNARLVLRGPGGTEDSLTMDGSGSFSLRYNPKNPGRYLYQIDLATAAGKTVEDFPVVVFPEKELNILIVQQFPSFEARQLKSFLASKGHQIAVRSQVSKNIFRTEFANRPAQNIDKLTPALLRAMDLLISTPGTLNGLQAFEWNTLTDEIRHGLGLVILMDGGLPLPEKTRKLLSLDPVGQPIDTVRVNLPWSQNEAVATVAPFRFAANPKLSAKTIDRNGEVLSGYCFYGSGKVGFQLLTATHRFALEGQGQEYAGLWIPLLEEVAREALLPFQIKWVPRPPYYPNEPVQFDVVSSGGKPELTFDGDQIPLTEDLVIDDLWHGWVVADSGWHTLSTQDSTRQDLFISPEGSWNSVRRQNQREFNLSKGPGLDADDKTIEVYQPVSPVIFFLMFVLGSGFLWLAPKV